ncbi:MAG: epoxyqueuosine reductase [Planctomycetota bacterium]|jgi:epoxyqueuosine reductase
MKKESKYPAPTFLQYHDYPESGNKRNGLGETSYRRPSYVFHSNPITGPLAWDRMQRHFRYSIPLTMLPNVLRQMWAAFRPQGAVAAERVDAGDTKKITAMVKAKALELGAGVVGICLLKDEHLMEGASPKYKYAISFGLPMNREIMVEAPAASASKEVQRVYALCSELTVDMARYIRSLGWPALGLPINSTTDYLHIPIAIDAGIGQLGKHGSLICKEYGSNFRLTTMLTDLPLEIDQSEDIGVDDVCMKCQACTNVCPPKALSDSKQWVRGVEKWYVDFDRCAPYFSDTYGCSICVEVCPWSVPGRGIKLSEKALLRRPH